MTALVSRPSVRASRSRWRVVVDRRLVLLAVVGYLLCRVFSAILMTWIAHGQPGEGIPGGPSGAHTSYWDETRMWDGRWYREIVERGYPRELPVDSSGTVQQNAWAFLPLYPMLVRAMVTLTGGSFAVVGSLLSLVAGAGAIALMAVLLRERIGAGAALASVVIFSALPPSPTFQMTYTESLALLVLVAFLLAVSREQWAAAAALALVMGLTRPIAAPMVLVVVAVAAVRWRHRRTRPVTARAWTGMIVTALACLIAGGLWAQIAASVTGRLSAYLDTQASWRSGSVTFFKPWPRNFTLLFGHTHGMLALAALGVLFLALVAGPWARGLGPVLLTWTVAYAAYLVATVDVWTSTYRYAMFLFPLVPILLGVGWRDRARRLFVPARCAIFLALALGWQVWWVWTLLRFVPPTGNPI